MLVLFALPWAILPLAVSADEPNRAGLAIHFPEGRVETRCIAFEEDAISGADLLSRSGLDIVMDASSGMGITVCQVEGLGCAYPAERCFCQCMTGSDCAYWNYYYRDPGETDWTYSALGALLREIGPGSIEAWVWGDGHTPPSADLAFESICTTPATVPTDIPPPSMPGATAVTATIDVSQLPPPTEAPAEEPDAQPSPALSPRTSPTQRPPDPAAATALPATTPATDARTDPNLLGYWPFGLMLLGLAAIGGMAWLRRI
jgi:hypothetical protein